MKKFLFTLFPIVLALFVSLMPFKAESSQYPHGDFTWNYTTEINDLTVLIDGLMKGDVKWYYDLNWDFSIDINDVTCMVDYLLSGEWYIPNYGPEILDSAEVFTVNGVTFAMMPVEGCESYDLFKDGTAVVSLKDYYMGQTEVTQALWKAVMGDDSRNPCSVLFYHGDPQHPVDMVSWFECRDFITRLNELTGRHFHLPTAAQWIYAAQGGKYTHGYLYSGSNDLDEVGWYMYDHPYEDSFDITFPVGLKAPNELGLYDMSGNVREWTRNTIAREGDALPDLSEYDNLYEKGPAYGGVSSDPDYYCRTTVARLTYRGQSAPMYGFRLALQKEEQ